MGVGSEQCFPTEATATPERPEQMSLPPSCSARCATPSRRWHATDYRYVGGRYGGCSEAQMMHEIYKHGPVVAGFEASAALYSHRGDAIYSSSSSAAAAQTQDALASAGSIDTAGSSTLDDPRRRQVGMVEDEPLPFNLLRGVRNPGGRYGDVEDSTTRADDGTRSSKAAGVRSPGGGAHSFFERTNHAVLVVGWGVEPDGRKYWWAQNTWGSEWGLVGYFKMARGSDASAFESILAKHVVRLSLLRIRQHFVRVSHRGELLLRTLLVARIFVRVELHCELSVCLLERFVVCITADAQDLVVVAPPKGRGQAHDQQQQQQR